MTASPKIAPAPQQVARTVWIILGPILCAVMGLVMVMRLRPNENKLHDFVQEWTSARNWLQGQPIYEDLHRAVADDINPDLVATLPIQYNGHPPVSALVTLPFGVLPYHQAVLAWNVLSLIALVISLALILGPGGLGYPRWVWWPVISLLLLSSPLAHQIYLGQLNLLLLLLFTLAWRLDRAGYDVASAACVAVAASIKIFPGFLLLYFLAQRRYRAVFAGVATLLLVNALSWIVFGTHAWQTYVTVVLPAVAGFRGAWANASIAGFWAKLFDSSNPAVAPLWAAPALAKALTALCDLTLMGVMSWSMFRASRRSARDCAFAAGVLATVLLSPIVWHHYFVILALPLLILWRQLPATWLVRSVLCAAVLLLAVNPIWITGVDVPILGPDGVVIPPSVALPFKTLTSLSFQFYAIVALWALGCLGCLQLSPKPLAVTTELPQSDPAGASAKQSALQPLLPA